MHIDPSTKRNLDLISQAIFDKKGFNILALDARNISTMADYIIIAEGTVDRHVKSLSAAIKDKMIQLGLKLYHADGERDAEWVVLDYGDIIVHLLIPDLREKYSLEELWKKANIVDVEILVGNKK